MGMHAIINLLIINGHNILHDNFVRKIRILGPI